MRTPRGVSFRIVGLGAAAVLLGVAGGRTLLAGQAEPPQDRPGAVSVETAVILTNGWAFLSQHDVVKAEEKARQALALEPRSPAAFALALETAIARAGSAAGLGAYDDWVGARAEEPTFLRRVAWVLLQEMAAQTGDARARLDALDALSAHGDLDARQQLAEAVRQGNVAEARLLAAEGDELAVRQLGAAIGGILPNMVSAIEALGESGRAEAVQPLLGRLDDPRPEVRGAVAEALGRTGGPAMVPRLRRMLDDQSAHVRVKAATALFRLGDAAGNDLLQELAVSDQAQVRLVAAQAMASRPDPTWQTLVRDLASASEPDVRLSAAGLAADFDPSLAASTLRSLALDDNPAIREAATQVLARDLPQDLTSLRALLRDASGLTRVAAARAVLDRTD